MRPGIGKMLRTIRRQRCFVDRLLAEKGLGPFRLAAQPALGMAEFLKMVAARGELAGGDAPVEEPRRKAAGNGGQ